MRLYIASLALVPVTAALTAPAAAVAQAAEGIAVGSQVVDTKGGVVGIVSSIRGDVILVKTDRHEVALPKVSFTPNEGKLLFGMTQAELNAATDATLAAAAANLVPGATVRGSAGAKVGTIDAIDTEFATIKLESGNLVRIPRSGIGANAEGAVIGLTAEQLEQKAEGAPGATSE
jgi:preprotein translocase subunit YajC